MSYIGADKIGKMYLGDTEIAKAYLGSNLVYRNKPYDAEVEYLESTGKQYINTGIIVNESDSIVADAQFINNATTTYNTIGDSIDSNIGYIFLRIRGASWYVRFGSSSTSITAGANYNRHLFELKKNSFSVDGNRISEPGYNSMPSTSYILGRIASNSSFFGRLFGFEIISKKNFKRIDLIPVRVGNVGYMYDKVSNQLFGNDGTGNFIVGPDINKGDIKK